MPVKSTRRPYQSKARAAASDETRARIVAAARSLLTGGKEMPAFSLDGVAREAGVTRLTVYNQFESKRGLLEAVFDETARQGGLFDLPAVLAERDIDKALARFVSVFCRFWATHGRVFPRFSALARLDDEIAQSIKQRSERRRNLLRVLVDRVDTERECDDLVDILFALTSFETFDSLLVRNRSPKAVEAIIQGLVAQTIQHATGDRRRAGRQRKAPSRARSAPGEKP